MTKYKTDFIYKRLILYVINVIYHNKSMLTGNKDVDRKILNNLEDKDLINICQTNKKAQSLYNDQVFWMNRVFLRFGYVGGDILRKHKKNRTWSEYYIKDLREINSTNAQKYLMNGSRNGNLDYVIISLKNDANIHGWDDYALRYSNRYGYIEVVKYLVSNGANIYVNDDEPLKTSSIRGHLDIVKYLVSNGANIHAQNDAALRLASERGHTEVVKYLVELKPDGANIHAQNDAALRYSSSNGHLDIVKYLVNLGANNHADDDHGLRLASHYGHSEVVKYLENIE